MPGISFNPDSIDISEIFLVSISFIIEIDEAVFFIFFLFISDLTIISSNTEPLFVKIISNFFSSFTSIYFSKNKGELGWINGNILSKQIYDIVSNMKPGEISKPIKQQSSVIFLKLNDKRSAKLEGLDETKLRKDLIVQKKNELFNLYSRSHLSKLKNTSLIEYR